MIVAYVSDPYLRTVVARAAHPEEDVILDPQLIPSAVEWGFPRLVVYSDAAGGPSSSVFAPRPRPSRSSDPC